ncbi:hypothetical protein [Lutibacter maritimus]|uniref:Uncharacterized protein n=1 Tax=Lutibacter maritimus TaxID=593133 RepID=A0A1I6SRJ4_9FLAO|nr:hypothetical protein [Lutibacter maritimus]SFS79523.1 hypothetical protein SAMN04488006_0077 [Lutibacter maritimus]
MKAVTIKEIKTELQHLSNEELVNVCLQLAKFKKENKELLTYTLFEAANEEGFIETVKSEADILFDSINTNSYFYIKKSVRKIVRILKTNIRYSKKKETEIELLLYFCKKMLEIKPSIKNNVTLKNIYLREKLAIKKKLTSVHEDLQYDYTQQLSILSL